MLPMGSTTVRMPSDVELAAQPVARGAVALGQGRPVDAAFGRCRNRGLLVHEACQQRLVSYCLRQLRLLRFSAADPVEAGLDAHRLLGGEMAGDGRAGRRRR